MTTDSALHQLDSKRKNKYTNITFKLVGTRIMIRADTDGRMVFYKKNKTKITQVDMLMNDAYNESIRLINDYAYLIDLNNPCYFTYDNTTGILYMDRGNAGCYILCPIIDNSSHRVLTSVYNHCVKLDDFIPICELHGTDPDKVLSVINVDTGQSHMNNTVNLTYSIDDPRYHMMINDVMKHVVDNSGIVGDMINDEPVRIINKLFLAYMEVASLEYDTPINIPDPMVIRDLRTRLATINDKDVINAVNDNHNLLYAYSTVAYILYRKKYQESMPDLIHNIRKNEMNYAYNRLLHN